MKNYKVRLLGYLKTQNSRKKHFFFWLIERNKVVCQAWSLTQSQSLNNLSVRKISISSPWIPSSWFRTLREWWGWVVGRGRTRWDWWILVVGHRPRGTARRWKRWERAFPVSRPQHSPSGWVEDTLGQGEKEVSDWLFIVGESHHSKVLRMQ